MKSKKVLSFVLTFSIMLVFSVSVLGLAGGVPTAHGETGKGFGTLVRTKAQTEPAVLAEHIAEKPEIPDMPVINNDISEVLEADESSMAGGMPAAHGGLTGEAFGAAVSDLAQSEPGAVAAHVAAKPDVSEMNDENSEILEADESSMVGGMPAVHGMTGKEFGEAVSELAQSEPGAVAAHVAKKPDVSDMNDDNTEVLEADKSSMAGGVPAAHELPEEEFGEAVSTKAQSKPGAVAEHVRSK